MLENKFTVVLFKRCPPIRNPRNLPFTVYVLRHYRNATVQFARSGHETIERAMDMANQQAHLYGSQVIPVREKPKAKKAYPLGVD